MVTHYFHFKDLDPLVQSLEKPVRELIELNLRTFQCFTTLTPVELLHDHKPEQIMERQVEVLIDNSHKALNYWQDMFGIVEKHWQSIADHLGKNAQDILHQGQKTARNTMHEAMKEGKRSMSTLGSRLKETTRKKVKKTKTASHGVAKPKGKKTVGMEKTASSKPTSTAKKSNIVKKTPSVKAKTTTAGTKTSSLKSTRSISKASALSATKKPTKKTMSKGLGTPVSPKKTSVLKEARVKVNKFDGKTPMHKLTTPSTIHRKPTAPSPKSGH